MTNDEFPTTKQIRNPNDEGQDCEKLEPFGHWCFDIRHSDFVVFQNLLTPVPRLR